MFLGNIGLLCIFEHLNKTTPMLPPDFLEQEQDAEQRLETIFSSVLDALRGVWDVTNAANVLLSLIFYKRILSLVEEGVVDFIYIDEHNARLIRSLRQQWLTDNLVAVRNLSNALTHISRQNPALHDIFLPLVDALEQEENVQPLMQVILTLDELDFSSSQFSIPAFGRFFNKMLYRIAARSGKRAGERTTPEFINELLAALARPQAGETIYDPSAGQGSTLIELSRYAVGLRLVAQERDWNAFAFCQMNCLLNGLYQAQLHRSDSLQTPISDQGGIADLAVANFPFGLQVDTEAVRGKAYLTIPFELSNTTSLSGNSLFIQIMLHQLRPNGRLIALLPLQSLYKDQQDRRLREYLVRRDWLEAVIALPQGMLYSTGSPICILILNKQKSSQRRQRVLFINAAALTVESKSRVHRQLSATQIACIAAAFHEDQFTACPELRDSIEYVHVEQIAKNGYNLNPKRYAAPFLRQLKRLELGEQLVFLREILVPESPYLWFDRESAPHKELPYLQVADLGRTFAEFQLQLDKLKTTAQVSLVEGRMVTESVLLTNREGQDQFISYFQYKGKPIVVHKDVLILKIDERNVSIEYLVLQMHGELFQQQVQLLKSDYSEPCISERELGQVQLPLPNIDSQLQLVREQKLRLLRAEEQKVETLRQRLNLDKQKAQSDQYKIISSIQHELGNRLPAVLTEFKNLKDFLQDKIDSEEPVSWEEPIFPTYDEEDVSDIDSLRAVVQRMERMLVYAISTVDAMGGIIKADKTRLHLERTHIKTFLQEFQRYYAGDPRFTIQIEVEEDEQGNELPIYTTMDRAQMTTVFSNLIENACRHGFVEQKKYLIHFNVNMSADKKDVVIEYKNDGRSFPDSFSFEDFKTYGNYAGDTGHSGIGGFLISQIISNHDGEIHLREDIDRNDPFKVQFEVVLPVVAP